MKSPASRPLSPLPFVLVLATSMLSSCTASTPKETWDGVYLNGRKIGYSKTQEENVTFRGKPAHKIVSISTTRLEMFGNKVSQDTESTSYSDSKYQPLYQTYKIVSNGSATRLTADYRSGKIVCTVDSGGGPTTRVVPVPSGVHLVDDSANMPAGSKTAIGWHETVYYLNPLTVDLEKSEITVNGQDRVQLRSKPYTAIRMTMTSPFGKLTSWVTESGEMLKGEMPFGMTLFEEGKDVALNTRSTMPTFVIEGTAKEAGGAYTPPPDLAVATAISIDKPIENPRKARSLSLTVSGVDNSARIFSDTRQRATPVQGEPNTYRLQIMADRFDPANSVTLPIREPSVQPYLQRAPYLETDNPQIQRTAGVLRGKETNAYRVATRICHWVHENMQGDYTIGVPRSCIDIYKRRRGVCRDFATLFAGLARAAGIHTRMIGGIVYAEGKFFYHAWVEVWVGRWVALDPTLDPDYVDATHIKFAQGDVTDMFNVTQIIGHVKLSDVTAE